MKLHIYQQQYAGDTSEIVLDKEAALELIAALAYAIQSRTGEYITSFESGGAKFDLSIKVTDDMGNLPYPDKSETREPTRLNKPTINAGDSDDIPF